MTPRTILLMTSRTILPMAQRKAPRPQAVERGLGIAMAMAAVPAKGAVAIMRAAATTVAAAGTEAAPAITIRPKRAYWRSLWSRGQLVERRAREQELLPNFDRLADRVGCAWVEPQVLGVQLVPGPPVAGVKGHKHALSNERIDREDLRSPGRRGPILISWAISVRRQKSGPNAWSGNTIT